MTGFEPALPAWRAGVLPLNYTRIKWRKMMLQTLPTPESNRDRSGFGPLSHIFAGPSRVDSTLTRTGGMSAGAMRGIGCSPRDAVIRPVNPLCTVFPLYAARPSVPAYRYSRVAAPCHSAGIEPAFPDFTRRTPYVPSVAYSRRCGPAPLLRTEECPRRSL